MARPGLDDRLTRYRLLHRLLRRHARRTRPPRPPPPPLAPPAAALPPTPRSRGAPALMTTPTSNPPVPTRVQIGKPYNPAVHQWEDGRADLRLRPEGAEFALFLASPLAHEATAFAKGNAEFAVTSA